MADIANPINPDGDVLDYEAEEPDEDHHEPIQKIEEPIVANAEPIEDDENVDVDEAKPDADEDDDEDEGAAVESLEEGEVSDEDEESRKERLKPQPVCRFYSKGQCTWGSSCRFVHPGVLDKGNYNMFAPPRPILPAEQEPIEKVIEEQEKLKSPVLLREYTNVVNYILVQGCGSGSGGFYPDMDPTLKKKMDPDPV